MPRPPGSRPPLPPPRRLPWPLKPLDSAQTSLDYDACGRMVMRIRHDLLRGITPAMIDWWFRNIGGDMDVDGVPMNRYLVWHPFDHIHWELASPGPDGGASAGCQFRIVEAFGRNDDFRIDVTETVTRLDATGLTLAGHRAGVEVTRLNHDFIGTDGGTLYVSMLRIGIGVPGLCKVVNPLIHRAVFPEAKGRAWLKHNVEEVGLLEHMLPGLWPGDTAAAKP
jgi:hypothetical protein